MMSKVTAGRMTAEVEDDFVVFLIGMRVNKPWKVHKWVPVARAMAPMLRTLSKHRGLGLMSFHGWIGPTGPLLVQYWRSVEQLEAFSRDPALAHHPAWRAFNKNVGKSGDVGIWHETYMVRGGAYETVYANMPRFGLARAGTHQRVTSRTETATDRRVANTDAINTDAISTPTSQPDEPPLRLGHRAART